MTGEYRYDDNGIRTYKEVNGNVTRYYLNGSTILTEETNYGGVTRRIDYIYDEAGSVYGFYVGGKAYYYQKNLQGDITGILDSNGVLLVEYIYDAYGVPATRFTGITDSLSDAEKHEIYVLGSNNPFRYRGYYYDTETGFYYLNSRYYDPQTGRFLNADGYASTGQGVLSQNMFAYCGNNPVLRADPSGNCYFDNLDQFKCKYRDILIDVNGEQKCVCGFNDCDICWVRINYSNCMAAYHGLVDNGGPAWPMKKYRKKTTYPGHTGIDLPAPTDTPVQSVAQGKVVELGTTVNYNTLESGVRSWGLYVKIEVSPGIHYIYAHLSKINVVIGQQVLQWDVVGYSGNTGYSTGPHLHFQVMVNNKTVSPNDYLPK